MNHSPESRKPWWRTLPAILTAAAAFLGGAATLVNALWPEGISGPQGTEVHSFDAGMYIDASAPPPDFGEIVLHEEHWDQVRPEPDG